VTVGEGAMMGRYARLGLGRRPSAEDRDRVEAALATVGMADLRERQVGALSGGQRRRVFLAKAIAADPVLYLLDEPVTGVDATTQEELMDVLEAESRAGKTVIASTHDLILAAQRFHEAAFINGRVVATSPAALVLDHPRRRTAATCSSSPATATGSSTTPTPRPESGGEHHPLLLMDLLGFFRTMAWLYGAGWSRR
jgi:ABC-type Mn2+/Zn2+ transport system ATPase subunit